VRVFHEKNDENNDSIHVKEGTVYTLGTRGRFHIKYTKNKYKEHIDFTDSAFKTLLGGFNEDEETLTNGQQYYSYESELSGTIRKNHLDGCEKNVLNTFVARTGQWATENGVNKMLRGKVVGVCETSAADAVARYSMKPPPLTWTKKKEKKKKEKRKNDDDDVNEDVMILPPHAEREDEDGCRRARVCDQTENCNAGVCKLGHFYRLASGIDYAGRGGVVAI